MACILFALYPLISFGIIWHYTVQVLSAYCHAIVLNQQALQNFIISKKHPSALSAIFTPQNIFDYDKSWCVSMTSSCYNIFQVESTYCGLYTKLWKYILHHNIMHFVCFLSPIDFLVVVYFCLSPLLPDRLIPEHSFEFANKINSHD